jgi:hypothetical protein
MVCVAQIDRSVRPGSSEAIVRSGKSREEEHRLDLDVTGFALCIILSGRGHVLAPAQCCA